MLNSDKEKVLNLIKDKIKSIENKPGRVRLIVDTIDIVALKELHNEIIENLENMDYLDQELTRAGLTKGDLKWLNESQKWLLTEPSSGPENFYCDGELNHTQALANWKRKMRNAGIPQRFITKATKTFI